MGTNLSQVFVANTDALYIGTVFNVATTPPRMGIWNLAGNSGTGAYVNTALYALGVDITDEVAGAGTDEVKDDLTTVANPVWLFNRLQFVQGTAGNPIATPIINTTNIKRIKYDPYVVSAGHKVVITPDSTFTATDVNTVTIKVILRNTPTDQLNFYDPNGTGLVDISGAAVKKNFPLGAFNTTNHKVISVEFNCTTKATFCSAGKTAIDGHALLADLLTATDTGTGTSLDLQARHAGVVFDVIVLDKNGNNIVVGSTAANKVVLATTAFVPGVGNPWQVLGDEIKCRSRYGNFNRMYLPQNMPTFTNTTYKYDKITIEYEHNWPTSTGIAPAGTLNQVVLYHSDNDGTQPAPDANSASTATANTFDAAFVYTLGTAKEFLW